MPANPPDDADLMMAIWHVYIGGITDPVAISRVLGKQLHGSTIKRLVAKAESLVHGPIPLATPIRCIECGGCIEQIPCRTCGAPIMVSEGYRETSHTSE